MTSTVAQIQFAAEFVTFLVAAAGLALVILRNELTTSRPPERLALAIGFFATALAAFGHGSLLLKGDFESIVIALRVAGIAGLAVGSIWWWRGRGIAGHLLWTGLFGMSVAVVLEATGAGRASDAFLATGSLVIGGALLVASRRSVAARVAASAAGTLLLVVLVLSVALSAVLSSSIQREELNRLQSRATTEANLASTDYTNQVAVAHYVGLFLSTRGTLTDAQVQALLDILQAVYPIGGLEFLAPPTAPPTTSANAGGPVPAAGRIIAAVGFDPVTATQLSGEPIVAQSACTNNQNVGTAYVVNGRVLSVSTYALCTSGTGGNPNPTVVGIVLRARTLDNSYLDDRHKDDPFLSLAIVDPNTVLARIGALPPSRTLTSIGSSVLTTSAPVTRVVGNQYVAAQPITQSGGQIIGAVVVSAPTSAVVSTRDRLFRTLFLIALGGTLLALGLAVVIGDRITSGLRRLTVVAESIRRGQRGERSGITSDDEVGVLGAAFDSMADSIEEQTRALRSAADDETRLRSRLEAVVAGMGDALVAVDANGNITDFNQSAEEMTGVTASQAIGEPVDEVVRLVNEDGGSLGPRLKTPSPSRWGMLATAQEINGIEFPVAVSAGALRGPGSDLVGQVLVLRDLRREREVERMKTEFLSRVGHELRTPLTGIMGYADFLMRRPVPAERAQLCYEEILVSAKRLLRVVEMLEFFASSGAGRVLLRPEPLDLRQLIDLVVSPWSERLPAPNTITRRVARRIPEINGDRRWLALAIDELIDNAVKFSPGGAQVTVTAVVTQARPPHEPARFNGSGHVTPSAVGPGSVQVVEISVMDRGKGMTPEEQATAFGEFVQGDGSDTRQFGGLGLGLSLVQRVVEGHGGTVKCTSLVGRGSTFTIVLPVPPEPLPPELDEEEVPGPDVRRSGSDDDTEPPEGTPGEQRAQLMPHGDDGIAFQRLAARARGRPRPPFSRRPRLRWRATTSGAVVAAVVTFGLAGCSHASSAAFAHLTLDGQAQILPPAGSPRAAHNGNTIGAGDRVQVTAGQAAVHLREGVLQLRAGSLLIVDDALRLLAGPVLIQPAGRSLQVAALDGALVVPSGVAQLAIGAGGSSLTAKVYQATAQLEVTGSDPEAVAAPRQVTLTPDAGLPVPTAPLHYEDSDPWDHLFLAPAVAISSQLAAAAAGFDAQVPASEMTDATFYQRLVPSLAGQGDFASALAAAQHAQPVGGAPAAKPGDYLIASVIALRGTRRTFGSRLNDELVFSAQGAPWGFVAYDQGVDDLTGVLNDVLAAIGRAPLPFTGPPGTQIALGPPTTAPPPTRPGRPPAPTVTTTAPNPGLPRPTTPATTTPTTAPPPAAGILPVPVLPGVLGQILNPLLDPLIQALNNILGGKG